MGLKAAHVALKAVFLRTVGPSQESKRRQQQCGVRANDFVLTEEVLMIKLVGLHHHQDVCHLVCICSGLLCSK